MSSLNGPMGGKKRAMSRTNRYAGRGPATSLKSPRRLVANLSWAQALRLLARFKLLNNLLIKTLRPHDQCIGSRQWRINGLTSRVCR